MSNRLSSFRLGSGTGLSKCRLLGHTSVEHSAPPLVVHLSVSYPQLFFVLAAAQSQLVCQPSMPVTVLPCTQERSMSLVQLVRLCIDTPISSHRPLSCNG